MDLPRRNLEKSRLLHRIFDSRRSADDGKTKASCSELLGVYGLLRFYFEMHLHGRLDSDACLRSFTCVCSAIDLLLATKRRQASVEQLANELDAATSNHMKLHIAAYGVQRIKPKHHWMLDVPGQARLDGLSLDAFIIERIHLRVKGLAEKIRKTTSFERSVLSSTLTVHLSSLEQCVAAGGLLGCTAPFPGVAGAQIADRLESVGVVMAVGDIVLLGEDAGVVAACALEAGELYVVVKALCKRSNLASCAGVYQDTGELAVWLALSCSLALAWRIRPDGSTLVVRR